MTITLAPALPPTTQSTSHAHNLPAQKARTISTMPLRSLQRTTTSPPLSSFRGSEASLRKSSDFQMHDGLVTLDTPLPPNFPSAERFAAAISIHALETLFGQRPIHQLRSWSSPALYQSFARRVSLSAEIYQRDTPRTSTHVRRIKSYFPRARVGEIAVILYDGERLHAAAIRVEVQHNHWKVTAFELA